MDAVRWVWDSFRRENRGLVIAMWAHAALLLFAVCALPFDRRLILGINPWIKPIKFDLSVMIFIVTIGVLLSLLPGRGKTRWMIGWGTGIAMVIEDTVISMQSLRGVRSHMNVATLFDGVAFGVMGIMVLVTSLLMAWLFVLYCMRQPQLPGPVVWGIRLGLIALLAGSVEGVVMISVVGAHTVGAPDGLAGLPFVNWSRSYGDLRVAHFFALHALQVMPVLGWMFSKLRWRSEMQVFALFTAAGGYMGMVWVLFRQAMAGRPVL